MGDADLIAMVPWLVFVTGLAVIGLRLVAGRRRGRPAAERPASGTPPDPARQPDSSEQAPRAPGA